MNEDGIKFLCDEIVKTAANDLIRSYKCIMEMRPYQKQLELEIDKLKRSIERHKKHGLLYKKESKLLKEAVWKLNKYERAEKIIKETELFFHSRLYYLIMNYPGKDMIRRCKDAAGFKDSY